MSTSELNTLINEYIIAYKVSHNDQLPRFSSKEEPQITWENKYSEIYPDKSKKKCNVAIKWLIGKYREIVMEQ